MYKNKNRYNDLINKYHYLEPLEKPRVYEGSVNTTHNLLVTQPKYLTALYFSMSNIFLQKPAIKKAKKSHASFKLRENMAIGTVSTFHGDMLNNFYYLTLVGVLPNINKLNTSTSYSKRNYEMISQVQFGIEDLSKINELVGVKLGNYKLGGGNFRFKIKSNLNKKLFYFSNNNKYLYNHHMFFISTFG
jgi:large subunit ribosomal protein L5